ncbi:hypothetical protein Q0M94_19355 (plasmid) [Deinococcus radiomollis]|uniref:hypothetical protein n=1 Tax=Deinococcus radiomollis TaxID=468916 RepID=UPI0038927A35
MRHVLTLSAAVLAASLSLASAQVRSQSIVVNPVQPAPVQPAPVPTLHLPAVLAELIRAGGTITLIDVQGRTVATVNQNGTLKLTAGMTLQQATVISVTRGKATARYPLAGSLSSNPLLVTVRNGEGRTQVITLASAVSQAGKKGDGKKKDGQQDGQGQNGEGQDNQGQNNQGQDGQNGNSGNGNDHH